MTSSCTPSIEMTGRQRASSSPISIPINFSNSNEVRSQSAPLVGSYKEQETKVCIVYDENKCSLKEVSYSFEYNGQPITSSNFRAMEGRSITVYTVRKEFINTSEGKLDIKTTKKEDYLSVRSNMVIFCNEQGKIFTYTNFAPITYE